jgi:hypothetical protein
VRLFRHCEEQSDEAIPGLESLWLLGTQEIASALRASQ